LIDTARGAIARGDHTGALAILATHAGQFSQGRLGEEREALRIVAIARAGSLAEAKRRAEAFRRSFPGSLFGPTIDAAVGTIP
jgi:hypothetical protein